MESLSRGVRKPDAIRRTSESFKKGGIAEEATWVARKQKQEIDLLFDHYEKLLKARGDTYDSLVRNAYGTAANYRQFADRLRKAEDEVTRAVMQEFGHKEGYLEIVARIEEAVGSLREEKFRRIFHRP